MNDEPQKMENPMENHKTDRTGSHKVILQNRKNMDISGVKDVSSFDEKKISLLTEKGFMEIRGQDLHVSGLSLEVGQVAVEGSIDSVVYKNEASQKEESLIHKLFR